MSQGTLSPTTSRLAEQISDLDRQIDKLKQVLRCQRHMIDVETVCEDCGAGMSDDGPYVDPEFLDEVAQLGPPDKIQSDILQLKQRRRELERPIDHIEEALRDAANRRRAVEEIWMPATGLPKAKLYSGLIDKADYYRWERGPLERSRPIRVGSKPKFPPIKA